MEKANTDYDMIRAESIKNIRRLEDKMYYQALNLELEKATQAGDLLGKLR